MEPTTPEIVVDAGTLRDTLRRLNELGGSTPGPAIWRAGAGSVEVEWKGGAEALDAEGDAVFAVRVDAKYMVALARTLGAAGQARIRLRDPHRVAFDTFVVPCVPVGDARTDLLPVQATAREVLLLGYRHAADEIREAGLEAEVEEARTTLDESVRAAADALTWAGVTPELLATWVDAHLVAVAAGKKTFELSRTVLVDRDGQLGLFQGK